MPLRRQILSNSTSPPLPHRSVNCLPLSLITSSGTRTGRTPDTPPDWWRVPAHPSDQAELGLVSDSGNQLRVPDLHVRDRPVARRPRCQCPTAASVRDAQTGQTIPVAASADRPVASPAASGSGRWSAPPAPPSRAPGFRRSSSRIRRDPHRGCCRRISATRTSTSVGDWCGHDVGRSNRSADPAS